MATFKNPNQLANSFDFKQDLANRVSRNDDYRAMANYAGGEGNNNDDYFYAFKDAYEKNNPDYDFMSERQLGSQLSDAYWRKADDYRDRKGYGQSDWDRYGVSEFEDLYGDEATWTGRGLDAWKRWADENYGGHSEDHINFGSYIRNNPDRIKSLEDLKQYHQGWGDGDYPEFLDWWSKKLGFVK